jgi:hypothetical protein
MRNFYVKMKEAAFLLAAILLTSGPIALAEPLSLQTGLTLNWDRAASPTNSPYLNLPVLNASGENNLLLTAFTFRLRVEPVFATGSINIDIAPGSVSYPAVSSVITANQAPITPISNLPNFVAFSGLDNLGAGYAVTSGQNLAQIRFTTSDNALGTFRLLAINDSSGDGTGWLDSSTFEPQAFSNSPFTSNTLELGTITVVPEPSAVILIGTSLGLLAGLARRYRRRNHNVI